MGIEIFKLKNGGYEFVDHIKTEDDIDQDVQEAIRKEYSVEHEAMMNRIGNAMNLGLSVRNEDLDKFESYHAYCEQVRLDGRTKLAENEARISELIAVTLDEGEEDEKVIYVEQ